MKITLFHTFSKLAHEVEGRVWTVADVEMRDFALIGRQDLSLFHCPTWNLGRSQYRGGCRYKQEWVVDVARPPRKPQAGGSRTQGRGMPLLYDRAEGGKKGCQARKGCQNISLGWPLASVK